MMEASAYLFELIPKLIENLILKSPLGRAIQHLMQEFICKNIIPVLNDVEGAYNSAIKWLVDLDPHVSFGSLGTWHLGHIFGFMKSMEISGGPIETPSFCNGLNDPANRAFNPTGSLCTGDNTCSERSTCLNTEVSPIKMEFCSSCYQGQWSCNTYSRMCECGKDYSLPSACQTNSQCLEPTARCLDRSNELIPAYSISECLTYARSQAGIPICTIGSGFGQSNLEPTIVLNGNDGGNYTTQSASPVCVSAMTVNSVLSPRVSMCDASKTGQTCSLGSDLDPTHSCLAVRKLGQTVTLDDLLLVSCAFCANAVEQKCMQVTVSVEQPPRHVCLCELSTAAIDEGVYLGPRASTRRLLEASEPNRLPSVFQLNSVSLSAPSECNTDQDCNAVAPPSVCKHNGTGHVFCDSCPEASLIGDKRPRVCLNNKCTCKMARGFNLWESFMESRGDGNQTLIISSLLQAEQHEKPRGECAVLANGLIDRLGGEETTWDLMLSQLSLSEKVLLESCLPSLALKDVLSLNVPSNPIDAPLMSVQNLFTFSKNVVGTIQALIEYHSLQTRDQTLLWQSLAQRGVDPALVMPLLDKVYAIGVDTARMEWVSEAVDATDYHLRRTKKFGAHDHHSQRIRTVLKQINSNTVTEIKELLVTNFMKNVTIISKAETEPYAFYRKSKVRALTQQEKDIDRMPQPVTISSTQTKSVQSRRLLQSCLLYTSPSPRDS